MDLRQIKFFVALFEEESITKAARRLHVVQPAVSMQIRRLEDDYGVPLFDRLSHGVYPNAVAKKLYARCVEILKKTEALDAALEDASGRATGRLTIGVPPSLAQGVLPGVLLGFHADFPDVQIAVHESCSTNLLERLIDGQFDFAVLSVADSDRRLCYTPLLSEELVVVTSAATKTGGAMKISDLARLKLVVPSGQNLVRSIVEAAFHQLDLQLDPAMEVDSVATILGMLRAPDWASILPVSAVNPEDAAYRGLRIHHLAGLDLKRTLVIANSAQKKLSALAQTFTERLREALERHKRPIPFRDRRAVGKLAAANAARPFVLARATNA